MNQKILKQLFSLIILSVLSLSARADEGMWIPMLLQKNEADMQKAGMRISAKDIYDVNNACLKDAVILFNQGCTGEFVSDQGLFLTNHHCGYSYITSNSTVEHDYLTHGFWAMDREQEIPCKGLTATRLVRMEDVTDQVLEGVTDETTEEERASIVKANIAKVGNAAIEGTHYKYVIKPFYYGNQYFMYINEVFVDVRLVGAPPSNIGKFGGDTDNWMWPRHTGDFSMFRVYVGRDGKPAPFSKDNVPYRPLKHLPISLKGVDEGDFTFVFGYPGTTKRYVTSDEMAMAVEQTDPICINLRTIRLKHYKNAMEQSPAQRLRYASKVAGIANGWKKWQGEVEGIQRLQGVARKKEQERVFQAWTEMHPEYADVLPQIHGQYETLRPIYEKWTYFREAVQVSDFMNIAKSIWEMEFETDEAELRARVASIQRQAEAFYNDFANHGAVDRAIFVETMDCFNRSAVGRGEYGNAAEVWDRSAISHPDTFRKMLKGFNYKSPQKSLKKLLSDPAVRLYARAQEECLAAVDTMAEAQANISRLMRTYMRGLWATHEDVQFGTDSTVTKPYFFPDANLTLRVTYGHVQGFHPRDGVCYKPVSTLEGIMQKENPDIYDYVVEPRLKELYNNKDYGRYANSRGEMPVCFLATNHTTGGNSGSPVINGDGQLVGINFDRCWEGTMSDLLFDPDYCRNISLDIRYCLFIIDKFAGAKHLVDEMTIVR